MDAKLGRLCARLAEPADCGGPANLIELINRNINPPTAVTAAAVHVRAMYIVSDEVNSFGGRFSVDEYDHLCRLLVDSPVMVGHRKDRLPIARNFHAAVVERNGRRWVKCWFYWLRAADGAETLRQNIDGGIYRECSISFTFLLPECSICGQDIRACRHQPGQAYTVDGVEQSCHYCYRRLERVLETSLVYRGAVPDTRLTGDLAAAAATDGSEDEIVVQSPTELPPCDSYLVAPCYEGIRVVASCELGNLHLARADRGDVPPGFADHRGFFDLPDFEAVPGYLLGLRGKERCALDQLDRFLRGDSSRVSRVQLRLLPSDQLAPFPPMTGERGLTVAMMRHRSCTLPQLDEVAAGIATRDGVRVWPGAVVGAAHPAYRYRPDPIRRAGATPYTLAAIDESGDAHLTFFAEGEVQRFAIRQFHLHRLMHGGKFLADRLAADGRTGVGSDTPNRDTHISGQVLHVVAEDGGFGLHMAGRLSGIIVLRPLYLDGERRFLFYRRR